MYYLSIDVESVGLWGEGFAYGAVLYNAEGEELEEHFDACPADYAADGAPGDRQWVRANVEPVLPPTRIGCADLDGQPVRYATSQTPVEVRESFLFLLDIMPYRVGFNPNELRVICDCPFPVETNFLGRAFAEHPHQRNLQPYPLIDVASVIHASGGNPLETFDRMENERPIHNPVCDARQSARLFFEIMREIGSDRSLAIAHGMYGPPLDFAALTVNVPSSDPSV